MTSIVLGKCKNPFTGADDCEVREGKGKRAYLVTPWGPLNSTAKGYDQWCRAQLAQPEKKPEISPEPVPGGIGPAPENNPGPTSQKPVSEKPKRPSLLSGFLP